jgi:hypothetical protein
MIVDLILDRYDEDIAVNRGTTKLGNYSPREFYHAVMRYGDIGQDISRAMDFGTESDVKAALCEYIVNNEYNPAICGYIHSVNWLTNTMATAHIAAIC